MRLGRPSVVGRFLSILVALAVAPLVPAEEVPPANCKGRSLTDQVIRYDAATQTFTAPPSKLKARSVTLKIENPNTFRYTYTIDATIIDTHTQTMPSALASLIVSKPPSSAKGFVEEELAEPSKAIHDALEEFDKWKALTVVVVSAIHSGKANAPIRRDVVTSVNSVLVTEDSQLKTNSDNVEKVIGAAECDHVVDDPTAYDAVSADITQLVAALAGSVKRSQVDVEAQHELWKLWFAANSADPTAKALNAAVEAGYADFKSNSEIVARLPILYANVLNPALTPTSIVKQIQIPNADELDIMIKVDQLGRDLTVPAPAPTTVGATTSYASGAMSSQTLKIPVYARWVVDFSAGVSVTSLRIRNYYMATTVDSTGKTVPLAVRQGPGEDRNLGPSVFAHVYWTTPWLLGLSFGPSLGVQATDPIRYLLGASAIIRPAKRIRLMLTGGWSYGKVAELNGDVLNGDQLTPPVRPLGASPSTAQIFRRGTFGALTMSLGF